MCVCVCIYVTFPNTLFFVCVWMCMWIKACLMSVTQKQMFCSGHDTMSFYSMKWASSLHCWSCSAWRLSECALHRLCVWVCAHILKVQRVMFKPVFNPETTFFFFFKSVMLGAMKYICMFLHLSLHFSAPEIGSMFSSVPFSRKATLWFQHSWDCFLVNVLVAIPIRV